MECEIITKLIDQNTGIELSMATSDASAHAFIMEKTL